MNKRALMLDGSLRIILVSLVDKASDSNPFIPGLRVVRVMIPNKDGTNKRLEVNTARRIIR